MWWGFDFGAPRKSRDQRKKIVGLWAECVGNLLFGDAGFLLAVLGAALIVWLMGRYQQRSSA